MRHKLHTDGGLWTAGGRTDTNVPGGVLLCALLLFVSSGAEAGATVAAGAQQGKASCPCIGRGVGSILSAVPHMWQRSYGPFYGRSCAPHDSTSVLTDSACLFANRTAKENAPSWCSAAWCVAQRASG
jgi:hypothetical protein